MAGAALRRILAMTLFSGATPRVISVADLNSLSREILERAFPLVWVSGEISGFTRAASGHCYFTLKDAFAQVRCVCFRSRFQLLDWLPADGSRVEVCALPTLYEPRGEFQLNVEAIRRAGLGALYEAFEKLKAKLAAEGLFDAAIKRPVPRFPRTIGIVTSLAAAALSDVLSILRRRMPSIRVIIYPTPVQGQGAGEKIAQAINLAAQRRECEVLILCRGGGSIEDLWPFNEEVIARAIRSSPVPIVSGVGHETDFTIADFAADVRAATPSAAAELVSPNAAKLTERLATAREQLWRSSGRFFRTRAQALDYLSRRLLPPAARLANERQRLGHLRDRLARGLHNGLSVRASTLRELSRALRNLKPELRRPRQTCVELESRLRAGMHRYLQRLEARTGNVRLHLEHLSPQAVLERGYSIVRQAEGKVVRGADEIEVGAKLKITFARGSAATSVIEKS